jgi:EmrB/QacA subfamily drug resistance transporter
MRTRTGPGPRIEGDGRGRARPAGAGRIGRQADDPYYRWWALSCTSLGMLMATINSGTLIIALPSLERDLHISLLALFWVILVYLIASTVLVLSAGRLSDLFGRKKAYVASFLVFGLGSLGAGFSSSAAGLIGWRLLMGMAAAFLFANATAIVTDAFPPRQLGLAMGTNSMMAAVGLVLGPILGGGLVAIGWQWVFWFNVPLALIGSAWGALVLRELGQLDQERRLDLLGTALFVAGLTGFVLALSRGGLEGWSGALVILGFAVAAALLPIYFLVEPRVQAPMLDLSIFRDRLFLLASVAVFLNDLARFAILFIFVFYFQGPLGYSPIQAGFRVAPMAAAMLVAAPIAGRLSDRYGSRGLAALGMLFSAGALAAMTTLGATSPYWQSALWLALVGVGSGIFISPNTAEMMGAVRPNRRGVAAGARTMLQNTGAVISISLVIAIVTTGIPKKTLFKIFSGLSSGLAPHEIDLFIANMHRALWLLAAFSLLGAIAAALQPRQARSRADS